MNRTRAWLIAGAVGCVLAWALGTVGFWNAAASAPEAAAASPGELPGRPELGDAAYRSLQLFQLESDGLSPNWQVGVARFLAPFSASVTLIAALFFFVSDRIGGFFVRWRRDHIVLCGAGDKGVRMVQRFARGTDDQPGDRGVVVIDLAPLDAPNLIACREAGAITLTGDARDPSLLRKAGVHRARYLVLACGGDGTNAEIAIQARDLVSGTSGRALRCFAHITDPALCRLLREREFELGREGSFRLEFFNIYSSAALMLLQEHPPVPASSRPGAEGPCHVAVVGLDPLGESVVAGLARRWSGSGRPPETHRLSLFDRGADERIASLGSIDPGIGACAEVRSYELDRALPNFDRDVLAGGDGARPIDIAYVCLHDDSESLAAALALVRTSRERRFKIVVSMMEDTGLAALLRRREGEFRDLHGFSVLDHGCTAHVLRGRHEDIARAVHEWYLREALAGDPRAASERTLVPWSALPESLKRSNRRQADHVFEKLETVGCALAPLDPSAPDAIEAFEEWEVDELARLEHERWVRDRLADGWRLGHEKNVDEKTTPYLVDWEELTDEIQELDRNAVRHLPDLVAMADLAIVRQRRVDGPGGEGAGRAVGEPAGDAVERESVDPGVRAAGR